MLRNNKRFIKNRFRSPRRASWQRSSDLISSFRYALQGIIFGFLTQRNFRIHLFAACIACSLGLWLDLKPIDFAVIVLTVTSVLVLELLNTAIEAVVDLSIGRHFHPLAKTAKDCSAASVLVASISSVLIGSLLLLPPLFSRIGF